MSGNAKICRVKLPDNFLGLQLIKMIKMS